MDTILRKSTCCKKDFDTFIQKNLFQFELQMKNLCNEHGYMDKLYSHAKIYELWKNNKIIAILCLYENDENHFCYIPYACVSQKESGKGYATYLFKQAILDTKNKYNYIGLEVRIQNTKALHLYLKLGFIEVSRNEKKIQMHLDLNA